MMSCCLFDAGLRSQRLAAPRLTNHFFHSTAKRFENSSSLSKSNDSKISTGVVESKLKWSERKEAPKWLNKMAPTKGGTKLPTPKEAAVIAVVAAVGYYAWFVEPPQRAEVADEQR